MRNKFIPSLSLILSLTIFADPLMEPTSFSKDLYPNNILVGNYSKNITTPDKYLGFGYGERVANPKQITEAVKTWSEQSNRIQVIEYAKSHEGRPLMAVFISSPENINKLPEIQSNISLLTDARDLNDRKAMSVIDSLPAIAWMAYSIHGNETSGADAALGIIYHLIASEDDEVIDMLDKMVVIIDPMMNPDGRDRFSKSLEQYRGTAPNYDDQSLLHSGDWPYGRTNHYFFDLNRDWIYLTQPETRGRVPLINKWRPQIMVDGHEMGSQDTFMTGPPREPINTNIDKDLIKWGNVFAKDQASAFDERDWRFYTGEWHEDLYPGYSFYVQFRGSLGILYEQSRMSEDGVRRPEGTIQSYKESVHHQFVSTLANLKTLSINSKSMYKDYWDGRKYNVSKDSKYANQTFVILPNKNLGRLNTLAEKLKSQDINIYTNKNPIEVEDVLMQSGNTKEDFTIPSGSMIIPNKQPEAPLIAAMLEFDAEIKESVLLKERQVTLKNGSSIMYDTTAFNLTMMYGLPAVTVPKDIESNLEPWKAPSTVINIDDTAVMWLVDGTDDRSVSFAARLMEQDVQVRIIDKEAILSTLTLSRGSVAVLAMDNPEINELHKIINSVASDLDISVYSVDSGFGPEELPDWGGRHFRLLNKPQIAILSHSGFSSYDVGVSWWSLDHHLGIRHSQLDASLINYGDLRRYNTLLLPSGYSNISSNQLKVLSDWVKQGGTLIANNGSSRYLSSNDGMGSVKLIQNTFDKSKKYNIDLQREFLSYDDMIKIPELGNTLSLDVTYPWEVSKKKYTKDELENRDQWQSLFMPSGAIVAGRIDSEHWLTFGTSNDIPLLYSNYPVLMTGGNSEAAVRIGQLQDNNDDSSYRTINWSDIPPGKDLNIRMSGLVWPEAAQRIANSAYLTRERYGKGQIILFSGEPNFRGSSLGTNRLWLNAVVYGSGLGTSSRVDP
tara:strand:+ start:1727 stop:4579 length:2853 start_codon:yes stop_codon:yes gene_type:complete